MKARRFILWAAVVGAAAAALVLVSPQVGGLYGFVAARAAGASADTTLSAGALDLSAPTTPGSCLPCHFRIAEGKQTGIVFNHATHLSFQCVACHPGNPHLSKGSPAPPMQLCYNCHGVQHGPQGALASSKCSDCHTASYNLTPASHTKGFAGAPHAQLAKAGGVNDCMMCHQAKKDCDACHIAKKVKVGPMPAKYQPIYRVKPQTPQVLVYPQGATSMGQCVQCHPDIDQFLPGKVIFQHAVHLRRNYPCEACHPKFGHQGETIPRPDMQSCFRCHGLSHVGAGEVATTKCDKCHPPGFNLQPSDHTQAFIRLDHGKRASTDGAYCAMCHQLKFCNDCHQGRKVPSWLVAGQQVIPKDHKVVTWRSNHGKLFLAGKGLCASCHDGLSCQRCHVTPMPHPPGWLADHRPKDIPVSDCYICHTDRTACQGCHHDKVKNAPLVAATCVGCHPEMKQTPATAIKNKVFAEHAVHFNVAKKKGAPYKCDDCHVDFGTSAAAQKLEKQQGHDLQLCYGCHGALDYQNRQIAPYPGADLCRRCHSNLTF
jgi:hypothetical protein